MLLELLEREGVGADCPEFGGCCYGEDVFCGGCYGFVYNPCPTRCDSILYCKWRQDLVPG